MRGQFKFDDDYTYRMPVHFRGWPFDSNNRVVFTDVLVLMVDQLTDEQALAQYIPSEFELLAPKINWTYSNCRGVDFMSNGEYRIFQASAPVSYTANGDTIVGSYPLIILEDDPVPIIGGREECGMPKVYCNICPDRHYENHWFAAASLYSYTMAAIDFREAGEAPDDVLKAAQQSSLVNAFGYRYIPHVETGGAATKGPVLYPQEMHVERLWYGEGEVKVFAPDAWYKLPSMSSTLSALAALPVLGFENAARASANIRLCVADSKAL